MSKFNVIEFNVTANKPAERKIVKGGKNLSRTLATKMAQRLNEKIVNDMCETDNLDIIVSYQAVPATA